MRRLILVYNPRSSRFVKVKKDVIEKLRGISGWMVGKFEVADTDVDDNAARLAKILLDGDLVIAAGGDGTANIALNGIMQAKKLGVRLGVLGYGNFNDTARSFGKPSLDDILNGEPTKVWPLECVINGKHWRWGMCYFTIGMFAEACAVFDHPRTRKALRKGNKRTVFSLGVLAQWWVRQRKKRFMPNFMIGGDAGEYVPSKGASDYMAVNGKTVAKIMKGGKYYLQDRGFLSVTEKTTKFWHLVGMMMKSIFRQVPGVESDYDELIFGRPAKMMFQAEGEYKMIADVEKVEIHKSREPLLVIMK